MSDVYRDVSEQFGRKVDERGGLSPEEVRREEERSRAGELGRLPGEVNVKVVGVTFVDGYPDNLHRLSELAAGTVPVPCPRCRGGQDPPLDDSPCVRCAGEGRVRMLEGALLREPDNPYDENAVKVMAGGEVIGHVPRGIAARMAPELDGGTAWTCDVTRVVFFPDRPENPGVWIQMRRSDG